MGFELAISASSELRGAARNSIILFLINRCKCSFVWRYNPFPVLGYTKLIRIFIDWFVMRIVSEVLFLQLI